MTDARLLCVASMVRRGAVLADIGTDHAYLPVHLIENGVINTAIAADIGEGPAAAARRTVETAALSDRVTVRVGDGLSVIAPDEVTDIVIAGMGGETIVHILQNAPWTQHERYRLVLQPMTKTVELRAWLHEHGFTLEEEHLVRDGHHLYNVMRAVFTGGARPPVLSDYVGALSFEEGLPYFERQLSHLCRRVDGMTRAGDSNELSRLRADAQALSEYMAKGKKTE